MLKDHTHTLPTDDSHLHIRTMTSGPMASMGHDLTLAFDWNGALELADTPAGSSLRVTADLRTMQIVSASGGAKPLSDNDRKQILTNGQKSLGVGKHPELTFVSTTITGTWESGRVDGELTLHGVTAVQAFDVAAEGDGFRLTGVITQSRFGIKPFSTMMGALKLGDDVAVDAVVK